MGDTSETVPAKHAPVQVDSVVELLRRARTMRDFQEHVSPEDVLCLVIELAEIILAAQSRALIENPGLR